MTPFLVRVSVLWICVNAVNRCSLDIIPTRVVTFGNTPFQQALEQCITQRFYFISPTLIAQLVERPERWTVDLSGHTYDFKSESGDFLAYHLKFGRSAVTGPSVPSF